MGVGGTAAATVSRPFVTGTGDLQPNPGVVSQPRIRDTMYVSFEGLKILIADLAVSGFCLCAICYATAAAQSTRRAHDQHRRAVLVRMCCGNSRRGAAVHSLALSRPFAWHVLAPLPPSHPFSLCPCVTWRSR